MDSIQYPHAIDKFVLRDYVSVQLTVFLSRRRLVDLLRVNRTRLCLQPCQERANDRVARLMCLHPIILQVLQQRGRNLYS